MYRHRLPNNFLLSLSMANYGNPVVMSLTYDKRTQYGLYQDAVSLIRSSNEEKWNRAIFWIFDSPKIAEKPIEERIEYLKNLTLPSFAKVVDFVKCEGKEHLKQFTDAILAKGGEGVMMREPGSIYKGGRSSSLRKHKPFFDAEVRVIKSQYPHGLICEQ